MPAGLLELGFISNANDLAVLKSADDRDKIAERLFLAFKEYKAIYDGTVEVSAPEGSRRPDTSTVSEESDTVYAVQIFAVGKKMDPKAREFLGYTPKIIPGTRLYKYCIGVSDTVEGARKNLPSIRKKYPDAFLVKIAGDVITRID